MMADMSDVNASDSGIQKIQVKFNDLWNDNTAVQSRIHVLEYKSVESEGRARRNNLIVQGIPGTLLNEDCESLLKQFIRNELNLDPEPMCIQRAHRLDKSPVRGRGVGLKHRPIIESFRDFTSVELLLANAYRLKNKHFGIYLDSPKEIIQANLQLRAS